MTLVEPEVSGDFDTILSWADEFRTMGVRANADTPEDAELGREFGAAGIGLCRTEHMFLGERKQIIQNFILAETDARARGRARQAARRCRSATTSASSRPWTGCPSRSACSTRRCTSSSTTRASSRSRSSARRCAGASNEVTAPKRKLLAQIDSMAEANPMLGLRGCRLGIMHPEIYAMQVRAIALATAQLKKRGQDPSPRS